MTSYYSSISTCTTSNVVGKKNILKISDLWAVSYLMTLLVFSWQPTTSVHLNRKETYLENAIEEAITSPSVLDQPNFVTHINPNPDDCTTQTSYELLQH